MSTRAPETTVALTPEMERLVSTGLASGRYQSAEEVVREGLILLAERDRRAERELGDIREKVAVASASAYAGNLVDGEEFFDQLEREEEQARQAEVP